MISNETKFFGPNCFLYSISEAKRAGAPLRPPGHFLRSPPRHLYNFKIALARWREAPWLVCVASRSAWRRPPSVALLPPTIAVAPARRAPVPWLHRQCPHCPLRARGAHKKIRERVNCVFCLTRQGTMRTTCHKANTLCRTSGLPVLPLVSALSLARARGHLGHPLAVAKMPATDSRASARRSASRLARSANWI